MMADSTTALFGISVRNKQFRTAIVSKCLRVSLPEYERIVFLVADRLDRYNVIAHYANDIGAGFRKMRKTASKHFEERSAWIGRLRVRLDTVVSHQEWIVIGMDDLADIRYVNTHRNVCMLYDADETFREDVERDVRIWSAWSGRFEKGNAELRRVYERLSTRYLLEEIALNIYVRWRFNIRDEYYAGGDLPKLYERMMNSGYSASVDDLLETDFRRDGEHRFFLWKGNEWMRGEERWCRSSPKV